MLNISRTEMIKSKGRITASFFDAQKLPSTQLERLNNRLSDIFAAKQDGIDNENS